MFIDNVIGFWNIERLLSNLNHICKYLPPILIAVSLFFASCNRFDVKEAVDQEYLDTPSYQTFRETSRSHKDQSLKGKDDQLTGFIKGAVEQRETENYKQVPFTIGEDYIDRLNEQKEKESDSIVLMGDRQRFLYLAKSGENSLNYHFFLLCKVSAYQDCAIGLATTDRGKMADLALLAPFKRMLTYDEISTLKIIPQEISIEIKSQVRYPIEQENRYQKRYKINAEGFISEADGN